MTTGSNFQPEFVRVQVTIEPADETGSLTYFLEMHANDPQFTKQYFASRRRFSELRELRRLLASRHLLTVPDLPPRSPLSLCCPCGVQKRARGVARFFEEVLSVPDLKSDACLKLFLQTNDKVAEIAKAVNERSIDIDLPARDDGSFYAEQPLPYQDPDFQPVPGSSNSPDSLKGSQELLFPMDEEN